MMDLRLHLHIIADKEKKLSFKAVKGITYGKKVIVNIYFSNFEDHN